jgi:hypothetical protein
MITWFWTKMTLLHEQFEFIHDEFADQMMTFYDDHVVSGFLAITILHDNLN